MSQIDLSFLDRRREDAIEFFNWPGELVDCLFKYSKEVMDNPWKRYWPDADAIQDFYKCPYYLIRQLSYSRDFASMSPGQQSRNECDEIIKNNPCSCLEIGCGSGDLAIYLAKHGVRVYVTEHSGTPIRFLEWRFKKYGVENITILDEKSALPGKITNAVLNSVLDHIYFNVDFTKAICSITEKKIFARPLIDETYAITRPETHDAVILKTVPECFRLIKEHNDSICQS